MSLLGELVKVAVTALVDRVTELVRGGIKGKAKDLLPPDPDASEAVPLPFQDVERQRAQAASAAHAFPPVELQARAAPPPLKRST